MKSKDGGPAFPGERVRERVAGHPVRWEYIPCMSLRDYFAGQALQCFLSGVAGLPDMDEVYNQGLDRVFREHAETVARTMYAYSDAMLAERDR